MDGILRAAGALLSWTSGGGKLAVLIYHRALAEQDALLPGEPDARVFEWQMRLLADYFRVLPLGDAIEELVNGRLAPRSACVTFDDGYADNYTVALPILKKLGLPATFFVATGFLDGGRMWNDSVIEAVRHAPSLDLAHCGLGTHSLNGAVSRRRAIDDLLGLLKYRPAPERDALTAEVVAAAGPIERKDLMMTSEQVAGLFRAGMEIGAHTVSHSLLRGLDDERARAEVTQSRARLRDITGCDIRVFAYPNGKPGKDYSPRDVGLLAELGFAGAVSTAWGAAVPRTDRLQVPRFTPWDRTPSRFMLRLLHNYTRTDAQHV
jgi:peptidoglycan/xylan/chitin deacetylase (PgdA/CDA1 family)